MIRNRDVVEIKEKRDRVEVVQKVVIGDAESRSFPTNEEVLLYIFGRTNG